MNFSKILLQFAILLKFLNCYPFLSFTIITGQRKLLSLAHGLLDRTPKRKDGFYCFLLRNLETFIYFALFCFYDIITNIDRKLEVVESNLSMQKILASSLCQLGFFLSLFLVHVLSFSNYRSLSLSQLFCCLSKARLSKPWLANDEVKFVFF